MADVKLVIKMPEEKYDVIKSDLYNTFPAEMREWGLDAIRNGILLPKRHGNLIDYYDAVELINNKADEENSNFTLNDIEKFGALLREVNPIIEADAEKNIL